MTLTKTSGLSVRDDFPLLSTMAHGHPLVYLDSAATSQKPDSVIEAISQYYRTTNANVHRGVYDLADRATTAYEGARSTIARFIGGTPEETILVRNASEAINLVARTWGEANLRPGDVIVTTPIEHHSNLVPWQMLAERQGATVRYVEIDSHGLLDLSSLRSILDGERVKLIATTYISNVLGAIVPVAEVARLAHSAGAVYLLDAAQAVPHRPVDVRDLGVDFMAFTGHKMLGPMGVGVLWGRRSLLEEMPPFLGGGEMIRSVGRERSTWNDLPWKFEAGTPSVADAVGLGAAITYLRAVGMERVITHDRALTAYAAGLLRDMSGVTVHGPEGERGPLVSFTVQGIHPHDLASLLDEEGIAVRAGQHCAQPLHDHLGIPATTRASFYLYNDLSDIDTLAAGIHRAQRILT